jgi:hypothetical protein
MLDVGGDESDELLDEEGGGRRVEGEMKRQSESSPIDSSVGIGGHTHVPR